MEYLIQFQASPYENCGGQIGSQTFITTGEAMAPEQAETLKKKDFLLGPKAPSGPGSPHSRSF
jgi:hypothetical protein